MISKILACQFYNTLTRRNTQFPTHARRHSSAVLRFGFAPRSINAHYSNEIHCFNSLNPANEVYVKTLCRRWCIFRQFNRKRIVIIFWDFCVFSSVAHFCCREQHWSEDVACILLSHQCAAGSQLYWLWLAHCAMIYFIFCECWICCSGCYVLWVFLILFVRFV